MSKHDADLELLQAELTQATERQNNSSLDDFAGLSPAEMTQFLYHPFDSPDLIQLPKVLSVTPSAPLLDLFLPLAAALTEKPIKLTARGNLPTAFCSEVFGTYQAPHDAYSGETIAAYSTVTEGKFQDLHVMRVVADLGGLVHKRNGKLHITRKASKTLDEHGPAGIYPMLFETYTSKYNWGYTDGYQPLPFIQHSWAFTCYLLQRFGSTSRPESFYTDRFLTAFPAILAEVEPLSYRTAEQTAANCYSVRALQRFLGFLGLADYSWTRQPRALHQGNLKRRPLLQEAVQFQVR